MGGAGLDLRTEADAIVTSRQMERKQRRVCVLGYRGSSQASDFEIRCGGIGWPQEWRGEPNWRDWEGLVVVGSGRGRACGRGTDGIVFSSGRRS